MEKIDIIKRKAVQIFSEEDLDKKLKSGKQLTIKFGADPSRPDLHIGHSVPLRVLKAFQEMGHKIVFVIGDFTAMIGDPSGKSKTRPALTFEETRKSAETYLEQVTKILDKDKTEIVFNSEWLSKMNFEDAGGNLPWIIADMLIYQELFPDSENVLSEERKKEALKQLVSFADEATTAGNLAKSIIAICSLGYDAKKVYTEDFKKTDIVKKLTDLLESNYEEITGNKKSEEMLYKK